MKDIKDLFNLVKQSEMTLIEYTFKDESIKDELISNFNYIEIEKIDSSFNFKSFIRDIKLDSLFNGSKNPEYILIDINNIKYDSVYIPGKRRHLRDHHRQIRTALIKIKEEIYPEFSSSYPSIPKYKIIVTSPLYKSSINSESGDINNFIGRSQQLYMCELAMIVDSDKIKVIKNRYGKDGDYILYNNKQIVEI